MRHSAFIDGDGVVVDVDDKRRNLLSNWLEGGEDSATVPDDTGLVAVVGEEIGVGVVGDGEDVGRERAQVLADVLLDEGGRVDRQSLERIDGHQDAARVGL